MREFASPAGRAAALSLPARILYTAFAALTLAGCASCIVLYDGMVQFGARKTPQELGESLVAHYRSASWTRLVETTHAHLFTMPVLLLVAGHLFLLSSASPRMKVAAVSLSSGAVAVHLAAPWLILASDGNALATALFPLSGGALLVAFTILLGVPVWQMWQRRPPA